MMEWTPIEARDHWVISITDKLEQANRDQERPSCRNLCIYKVPRYLQENYEKLYFPVTVSLGPYHYGDEKTQFMERHKWRAVNMVLRQQGIKMYINAMRKLEAKARDCYEGTIDLSSNEFVEMLVRDGCFILEVFRGAYTGFLELGYGRNDPVFGMQRSMHSIQRDMLMLENQLPLFVLTRLLELQLGSETQPGLVAQLAVRFFDPLIPTNKTSFTKTELSNFNNSLETNQFFEPIADKDNIELHCLDVFRQNLFRPSTKAARRLLPRRLFQNIKHQRQLTYCVSKLREAGIKFRRRNTDQFWDIRFKNGYLEIPKLLIHDGTKSLFSNLIAFEQCHIDSSNDITSYIIFMDDLIDTAEDVSYLHNCGIIEHWLKDSEVADLFNRLCQNVAFDPKDSYLSYLSHKIDHNYNRKWSVLKTIARWNVWKKSLKEKYFDSPWAYISFFAAVLLLFLTLSQTYFAAYAYYKPQF